jgi:hypothetical protein
MLRFATLAIVGCAGLIAGGTACSSHSVTQSEATFLLARPHEMVVQLDSQGAFATSRSLPLGNDVKVTLKGEAATMAKLHEGQRIRISRDANTRQVVAIDGL